MGTIYEIEVLDLRILPMEKMTGMKEREEGGGFHYLLDNRYAHGLWTGKLDKKLITDPGQR